MKKNNFIIISSIDWSINWQIHQQLATSLSDSGHEVLFIENTGLRTVKLKDIGRVLTRFTNWLKSLSGFTAIKKHLTLYSPLFLPFPYSKLAIYINRYLLFGNMKNWMNVTKFNDPIVISFLPTPLTQGVIKDINPRLTIYYCADNLSSGSKEAEKIKKWEDIFIKEADLVFYTSEAIGQHIAQYNNNYYKFSAGVDLEKFENARKNESKTPNDLKDLPKPLIGYVGALSAVLDQEIIIETAKKMPNASIVLIGPKYTNIKSLESIKNIKILGARSHNEIPLYIKNFDVALIPYIKSRYTDSVYSAKLNEYLAMGIPVVTTNIDEMFNFVEEHGPVISIGKDTNDFISKIDNFLKEKKDNAEKNKIRRITIASKNSWDKKFNEMIEVINKNLMDRPVKFYDLQKKFKDFYIGTRYRLFKWFFILSFCFLTMFYTPLFWYLGNNLVVTDEPKLADAIVVFSGDGEASFVNTSYQRRTIDAINYYKKGYSKSIILSSGRAYTFAEGEIIKSLLLSNNIPKGDIEIVDKFPTNTYENVIFVYNSLKERNLKSILFLTSPYHTKRSSLIWKKHAPDIEVIIVPVVDTPNKKNIEWKSNLGQIKVILYEYSAIVYNWFKNRL